MVDSGELRVSAAYLAPDTWDGSRVSGGGFARIAWVALWWWAPNRWVRRIWGEGPSISTFQTSSGTTAVKVVFKRRGKRSFAHVGSVHDAAELEVLMAQAERIVAGGQQNHQASQPRRRLSGARALGLSAARAAWRPS